MFHVRRVGALAGAVVRFPVMTVLYLALTVSYLALTVLHVTLTVLYVALTVLHVALTVLYVGLSQGIGALAGAVVRFPVMALKGFGHVATAPVRMIRNR